MNRLSVVFAALATALAIGGCGTGDAGDDQSVSPPPVPSPKLAVSVPPMPKQVNRGRQDVSFDPCVGIDDSLIVRSGFDPATRERDDLIFDDYSFIGCEFNHKEDIRGQKLPVRSISIWSTNITLDEFRQREGENLRDLTVDGRASIQYTKSSACYIAIQSLDGVLNLSVSTSAPFTEERPCDRIVEIAQTIAPALPD
ncbi:DUF3558 domain-containing protein [Nocardia amikacinitolerans]|uniref:DUF3558 domain-containing protein n=1 Tax=Nocardia amikacinitolerans TaxID=756689 RepID=UPI0020A3B4B7|nr:DUF3558 domain-containing protein [Nocardia amikacinitolerans]